MAEKKYEILAKQVQLALHQFRTDLNNIGQASAKIKADPRYTDIGRKDLEKGLIKELNDLIKDSSDSIRATAKEFCNAYEVVHPDDGEKYSQEVSNALQVINLCGFNLTKEVLREAVEPMKSSYSAMKLVYGVIHSKQESGKGIGLGFNPDMLMLLDDYMGTNGDIEAYNDTLNDIREVLNYSELVKGTLKGVDMTGYEVFCLADNMMKVGKLFEELSIKYPHLFK